MYIYIYIYSYMFVLKKNIPYTANSLSGPTRDCKDIAQVGMVEVENTYAVF